MPLPSRCSLDWMMEESSGLRSFGGVITIFHGDGQPSSSAAFRRSPRGSIRCLSPPHETWGTHHSKAVIVIRPSLLSVHVVTANFIFSDWENKTNGVWSGAFPSLSSPSLPSPPSPPPSNSFGADLLEYYQAVKRLGSKPPRGWGSSGAGSQVASAHPSFIACFGIDC